MQRPTRLTSITKVGERPGMRGMQFGLGWLTMLCAVAVPLRVEAANRNDFVGHLQEGVPSPIRRAVRASTLESAV
jgi:hypothetical protein